MKIFQTQLRIILKCLDEDIMVMWVVMQLIQKVPNSNIAFWATSLHMLWLQTACQRERERFQL